MSQAAYSELEGGKRRIDIIRLIALAELFDVPIAFFFETLPQSKKKKKISNKK